MSEKSPDSDALPFSTRSTAFRLFATCWIVYALHFATNIVREIYPALTLGDHLSFRVDEYAHLHPDLFEKEGYGWHINNNPGASMLAAIPYTLTRPVIDHVVEMVRQRREAAGTQEAPKYESPWPMARDFYASAWKRGIDIKLGLAAFVMQSLCMAPISALGAVAMFFVLCSVLGSEKKALWFSLLYAFGTPVFFRTGTLNQNMLLGNIAFLGFVAIWNPTGSTRFSLRFRVFMGGLAGGASVLMDYSGVILLIALLVFVLMDTIQSNQSWSRSVLEFGAGAILPLALLWFYQWKSFGHPFYPPQHYMPEINPWVGTGYQGYAGPQWDLFIALAFDYRFGLFVSSPILILAFLAPWRKQQARISTINLAWMLSVFILMWIFFSGSNYTHLQFNTGVRYLTAVIPFLFIPVAIVMAPMNRALVFLIAFVSLVSSWCLALYRDVERGYGVLEPVIQVFQGDFQLPALRTLSHMDAFSGIYPYVSSPIPFYAATAGVLWMVWRRR